MAALGVPHFQIQPDSFGDSVCGAGYPQGWLAGRSAFTPDRKSSQFTGAAALDRTARLVHVPLSHMTRLIAILLAVSSVGALAAPPKIALVRVRDIYRQLPSTKTDQAAIEALRAEILKDQRAEELRKLITELQTLQAELQRLNENAGSDTTRRDALVREYEVKRSSVQSLQQDFETFRNERNTEINRKMVEGMKASLERITAAAQKLGSDKGYDWVLDSSGNTNTGLPFVLYSKDAKDLTDELTAALSNAPASAAAAPAPAPSKP